MNCLSSHTVIQGYIQHTYIAKCKQILLQKDNITKFSVFFFKLRKSTLNNNKSMKLYM